MSRDASTYRGSRRNACLRERPKSTWGPDWYYSAHNKDVHRYEPAMRVTRKKATTSGGVHELLKRGDYAGATRAFFAPRVQRGALKGE
jgi:hypothetical protein